MLNLNKPTGKCLESLVGVVPQEGLIVFVLLTGPDQLGLVCRSERHRELTLRKLISDASAPQPSLR